MTEEMEASRSPDPVSKHDAHLGYEVAIKLLIYQGQLNWNRFSVMLVANSVIIAAIGLASSDQNQPPFLPRVVLPALGLFLCGVWAFLTARGFVYHRYWGRKARDLELAHLAPTVTTLGKAGSTDPERSLALKEKLGRLWSRLGNSDGDQVTEEKAKAEQESEREKETEGKAEHELGRKIEKEKGKEPGEIEFNWLSEPFRLITTQRVAAYSVIFVFAVVYVILLIQGVILLWAPWGAFFLLLAVAVLGVAGLAWLVRRLIGIIRRSRSR